jgi:alpha-L-fucosidase
MRLFFITISLLIVSNLQLSAQNGADTYIWPTDSLVRQKLNTWQDQKFGVLITWGLYSHKGILESWGLCPEDEDWIGRNGYVNYFSYASDYRNTRAVFNPVQFNPDKWAAACKGAGVKYMIFVTKHHDGFCMFDSKYTDFKITDKLCPFSSNPKANIAKEVFSSFRNQGLSVGAYFSKPDWSSPDFWWPFFPPKDRNPNYDITKHPERWNSFVRYTRNQLNELVSGYGKLDILWLDGCWVRPLNTINKDVEAFCKYPFDMDIDLKSIAVNARMKQPGMLVVDRWVPGPYEDYLTPEQKTPEKALSVPWESCITMATDWGWTPHANYKSSRELIQLLVNIVSKGGNLLLGIGPDGKGEFDTTVYQRLEDMGNWLKINGNAIYGTRPVEPFKDGNIAYTSRGPKVVNAIYLPSQEEKEFPAELHLKVALTGKLKVSLPAFGQSLRYKTEEGGISVPVPEKIRPLLLKEAAVVIEIKQ